MGRASNSSCNLCAVFTAAVLSTSVSLAYAVPTTFVGFDVGAGPVDPHPNSAASAASFDVSAAVLGTVHLIDFESRAPGFLPYIEFPTTSGVSPIIAPGVKAYGTIFNPEDTAVVNAIKQAPAAKYGFNTTAGGSHFLQLGGGMVEFDFDTPIDAFGAYFSGLQLTGGVITFSDGTSQSVSIPANYDNAALAFIGFTDFGASITSIVVKLGTSGGPLGAYDYVGIDDVRFVTAGPVMVAPVPEASTFELLALGLGGVGFYARRRKPPR